jgi:hypothetical protein
LIWLLLATTTFVGEPTPPHSVPPTFSSAFAQDLSWDDHSEVDTYFTSGGSVNAPVRYESRIGVRAIFSERGRVIGAEKPDALEMNYSADLPDSSHRTVVIRFNRSTSLPERLDAWVAQAGRTRSTQAADGILFEFPGDPTNRAVETLSGKALPRSPDILFYDGLPLWLRGRDLATPAQIQIRLLPTQLSNSPSMDLVSAEIEIIGPAGPPSETSHGGLEVDVHYEGKVDKLWFHPGPGHVLLVWEKADGTQLTYKGSKRE